MCTVMLLNMVDHLLAFEACLHMQSGGFGALTGGYIMECDCGLARKLLGNPPCPILATLGAAAHFELAVGQNGRVWVSASTAAMTVLVATALRQHAHLPQAEAEVAVKHLLESSR